MSEQDTKRNDDEQHTKPEHDSEQHKHWQTGEYVL